MNKLEKVESTKVTFTLPLTLLADFDGKITKAGMNRSEALRRGMRMVLDEIRRKGR